jgi:hypothetical protein
MTCVKTAGSTRHENCGLNPTLKCGPDPDPTANWTRGYCELDPGLLLTQPGFYCGPLLIQPGFWRVRLLIQPVFWLPNC